MTKVLNVYLNNNLVGKLVQNKHGQMTFTYEESWIYTPTAIPLSQSLPLQKEPFKQNQCRGYFAGILPEENIRNVIAGNLGLSSRNDFAMLEIIGGECAGAVTFIPEGKQLPNGLESYRALSDKGLADIIKTLSTRPLMAGENGIRLSLAGAQEKIAVHIENGQISIPLNGAPSTHILKPANTRFDGLIYNEAMCMKLAAMIGLPTAKVKISSACGMDYLLIERYDRKIKNGKEVRLHQEDFCQALGVVSEMKYEAEGGPTLKACFNLIRNVSIRPVIDLQHLLDAVIFNFLIGNNDAHGKNFSILYYEEGGIGFAPLYDILSTSYYPELSNKMAMKIGGEYVSDKILPKHFERLAEDVGFSKPMIKERIIEITKKVLSNLSELGVTDPISCQISTLIQSRCERTMKLFS
ncbi:MAG: hypothetical protein K0R73_1061 [Candidatus Midichloriaceae bacterium]|jgi:serine/threonine-protein kinase HipA|nr:hypothetical protein [Candidatus Midichloriaceae bacterium]